MSSRPAGGDGYLNTAAVALRGDSPHEPALLRPVDEPGHTGLVQLEERCQFRDRRVPVAEYAEQPGLDDRRVVSGRDLVSAPCTAKDS